MANNLSTCVTKFTKNLDAIVESDSLTSFLNINSSLVGDFIGAGQIQVAKLEMDGLADYNRAGGFVDGGVSLNWETRTLEFDRGRSFTVDVLDDEEREQLISAKMMAEFARAKVIPEMDAIRFARLAKNAGTVKSETYTTADAAYAAILAMEEAMQDKGVALADVTVCMTANMFSLLRQAMPYRLGQGENPNGVFTSFDGMPVVIVPSSRFYTDIDLLDGTTSGEATGGYKKSSTGKDLNFVAVGAGAASAIQKHEALRYFAPEVNQTANAHKWQYRVFHDLIVLDNKKPLIYCSHKA